MTHEQLLRLLDGVNLYALAKQTKLDLRGLRRIRHEGRVPRMDTAERIVKGIKAMNRQA